MSDIHNNCWLREFIHKNEGNSVYTCMYCDNLGLVTVGVGNLLPSFHAALALHLRRPFYHHRNEMLTVQAQSNEVQQEWIQVHERGRLHPYSERAAKRIASLRLRREDCLSLLMERINNMISAMYGSFPWARDLPDEIQMAVIDARYNPKGINPFQEAPLLWSALHSNSRNLDAALRAFTEYWQGGNDTYQGRQQRRLILFQQGVDRLRGITSATWAINNPPSWLW